jgi:serine O-acetyltransferase
MTTAPTSTPIAVDDEALPPLSAGDRNANPPGIGLMALLREDYRTNGGTIFDQGFWAIAVHRFGNYRMGIRFKPFRVPMTVLYGILYKLVEVAAGISLPYTVRVGRRVRLWHHSGMILHAHSIGDDVQIRHNTTFGVASPRRLRAIPTIGDIGCGACILGWVKIGDDARIGANAVVLSDVPAGATAVGVPARIIRIASGEAPG